MNPTVAARKIKRSFIVLTVIFTILVAALTYGYVAKQHRIHELETARIASCLQTYDGIHEVFRPLFTDPPQTPRRVRRAKLFETAIITLKKDCHQKPSP